MNATNATPDWSDDAFFGGNLTLRQRQRGHRAGTDAVLLASLIPSDANGRAVDAGAASGAVGLMLAHRAPHLAIDLVEIDPGDSALAAYNIAANGLADRCRIVTADLLASETEREAAGLVKEQADYVLSNPPYLNASAARLSPDPARVRAHALPAGGLERWCRALTWLAAHDAMLAIIHRVDALPELLQALEGRFGGIAIRPVLPRADAPASRLLVTARRGSRGPLSIQPGFILHGDDGCFTQAAAALHAGKEIS